MKKSTGGGSKMKKTKNKLKTKIKKLFHKCKVVSDMYPSNKGDLRIVRCEECGRYFIVDMEFNNLRKARIKSFETLHVYIKGKRDEK